MYTSWLHHSAMNLIISKSEVGHFLNLRLKALRNAWRLLPELVDITFKNFNDEGRKQILSRLRKIVAYARSATDYRELLKSTDTIKKYCVENGCPSLKSTVGNFYSAARASTATRASSGTATTARGIAPTRI